MSSNKRMKSFVSFTATRALYGSNVKTWSSLLKSRYGHLTDDERVSAWESAKQAFELGEWIEGEVVAVAPFGVWIDFGVSTPGLLLLPRFEPKVQLVGEGVLPQPGEGVRSRLISFNEEDKTLVLSQDPKERLF